MKKKNTLFYYITVFTLAQLSWFILVGLWIYWYISNYIIIANVGDKLSPQIISESANILALISGLVLLVFISVAMSVIFIYLTRQMQLTRMYDNFIANVTHELKSPLSSIQLYLETLYTRVVPADKKKEFYNQMMNDANRLDNLINSILDISGRESKKLPKKYSVYDGAQILPELLWQAKNEFKIPDSAFSISGELNCQCVLDKNAMRIVVNNLFDNAIKYSPNPAKIMVVLSQGPKYCYIFFSDEGVGISLKEQPRIFNKFERIYNRDNPSVTGTGLGLYWVRQIIDAHGGTISVSSKGQNKGATFKIALPIYRATKKRYINYLLKVTKRNMQSTDEEYERESV